MVMLMGDTSSLEELLTQCNMLLHEYSTGRCVYIYLFVSLAYGFSCPCIFSTLQLFISISRVLYIETKDICTKKMLLEMICSGMVQSTMTSLASFHLIIFTAVCHVRFERHGISKKNLQQMVQILYRGPGGPDISI